MSQFLTETIPSAEPVNEMGVALALAHYFEEQLEETGTDLAHDAWTDLAHD